MTHKGKASVRLIGTELLWSKGDVPTLSFILARKLNGSCNYQEGIAPIELSSKITVHLKEIQVEDRFRPVISGLWRRKRLAKANKYGVL